VVSRVCACISLSVTFNCELCKNGWTYQDVDHSVDLAGPKELCIQWGLDPLTRMGTLGNDSRIFIQNVKQHQLSDWLATDAVTINFPLWKICPLSWYIYSIYSSKFSDHLFEFCTDHQWKLATRLAWRKLQCLCMCMREKPDALPWSIHPRVESCSE